MQAAVAVRDSCRSSCAHVRACLLRGNLARAHAAAAPLHAGLPPYMGMLSGLAVLWLLTDSLHFGESKTYPRTQDVLRNVDLPGERARACKVAARARAQACARRTSHPGARRVCMHVMLLQNAGVMFFLGVLLSVEALGAAGLLGDLARALNDAVPNVDIIAASIGVVSALIDNVRCRVAQQRAR